MRKTKMIKVHFSGWQIWIFSLTVNLLVLAMQPWLALAQGNTDRQNHLQTATKTEMKDLEPEILSEINRVRTNPQDYAQWLEEQRQYYDGIWLRLPGEKPIRTNRGRKALEEAIAFLKQQEPLPPLAVSTQTAAAATSELEKFANANNIQYFSYGRKTATGIVMDLVVDELFPDRRRRQSLLSPKAEDTGVVCKPDPRYAKVCAIAYSDSPTTTNIATAQPEKVSTPNEPVAAAKPKEPVAELPEAKPTIPTATAEAKPEPKVTPQESAKPAAAEKPEETVATATLPVPPQPQIPTTTSARPEVQPQPTEEEANVEAEKPEEKATQAAIESEMAEIAEENQTEEIAEEIDEEAENREDDTEDVAINTETAGFSEKVERGILEQGDRVIADDGSLYDFYPIQGKAGESLTIYLESDEFDAFLALVDSNGKTVDENDDVSQEDSNSQIKVTLPEDGIYNVIVNTYDEDGTGEYVLTVRR